MVNNDDNACTMQGYTADGNYTGVLSGRKITVSGGCFMAEIAGNSGEIWVPDAVLNGEVVPVVVEEPVVTEETVEEISVPEKSVLEEVLETAKEEDAQKAAEEEEEASSKEEKVLDLNKPYEEMSIEELQACILAKMAKNGPVTDEMKRTVDVNVHHGSLMNWVRSFNN